MGARPDHLLLGDAKTDPLRLVDHSHIASVEARLIDVGAGTNANDYGAKKVRGKIVLADGYSIRAAGFRTDVGNRFLDRIPTGAGGAAASSPR